MYVDQYFKKQNTKMLDQEDFYQLIKREDWTEILSLLHTHKKIISTDQMLKHAATVFENEFFKKLSDYEISRKDIENNLDTLYILNYGKFYVLSPDNYKKLIIELVKRKPLSEAHNYANSFPEEEICKTTISKYKALKIKEEGYKLDSPKNIPMNWNEIFNRLFELMNNQDDPSTYFSGPRFINTIKKFDPYFPDYSQFMEQRNREGKSTTRKIYYYDILLGLEEKLRLNVILRLLEMLKPFQPEKVEIISELIRGKINSKENNIKHEIKDIESGNPIVFISYSWDDEQHKEWVLNLADRLCSDGIDVILDRYYLNLGKNLLHFVEQSISKADRIIIVFTPNYKLKADQRKGGVGYEYSIMNVDLYNNQTSSEKIIPILRAGSKENSIPTFMQQFIHLDIRNNENFETSYLDLLRDIYNEPAIQKPQLGFKPTFEKKNTIEVEKPIIGSNDHRD